MPELTLAKLLEVKKQLDKETIKPYKRYIGMRKSGFFQINSEEEYILLEEIPKDGKINAEKS